MHLSSEITRSDGIGRGVDLSGKGEGVQPISVHESEVGIVGDRFVEGVGLRMAFCRGGLRVFGRGIRLWFGVGLRFLFGCAIVVGMVKGIEEGLHLKATSVSARCATVENIS